MKIETRPLGIVHFYAVCYNCDWKFEKYLEREAGYREIRKHVSKTGHTVDLERAIVTRYSADTKPAQEE